MSKRLLLRVLRLERGAGSNLSAKIAKLFNDDNNNPVVKRRVLEFLSLAMERRDNEKSQ